mmetsp:Transcript_20808/g.43860  ORF Transcript_20808/g.43860 Transcript_20808/m.43860 type:complete len:272 (+) Transcript_20808:982-1797(+)
MINLLCLATTNENASEKESASENGDEESKEDYWDLGPARHSTFRAPVVHGDCQWANATNITGTFGFRCGNLHGQVSGIHILNLLEHRGQTLPILEGPSQILTIGVNGILDNGTELLVGRGAVRSPCSEGVSDARARGDGDFRVIKEGWFVTSLSISYFGFPLQTSASLAMGADPPLLMVKVLPPLSLIANNFALVHVQPHNGKGRIPHLGIQLPSHGAFQILLEFAIPLNVHGCFQVRLGHISRKCYYDLGIGELNGLEGPQFFCETNIEH